MGTEERRVDDSVFVEETGRDLGFSTSGGGNGGKVSFALPLLDGGGSATLGVAGMTVTGIVTGIGGNGDSAICCGLLLGLAFLEDPCAVETEVVDRMDAFEGVR